MCGIVGAVDPKGIDQPLLLKMRDSMVYRGPDDSGIWVSLDRTIGLAHRRLSIIDLTEAGRQPMSDPEEKVWLIFNGEIYNFLEIRKDLEKNGYVFKSHTDTEVILYAYKEWGTDCLEKFNGMFAFGIYDDREKIIFLARDRVGKKPLYYSLSSGKLIFASELKALLYDETLSRKIDFHALNHYLAFGYIGEDLCIYNGIKKLLPAHAMVYHIRDGSSRIWKYWEPPEPSNRNFSENELLEELEEILKDAVRLRMISDVPIGAFLSGGIDSSLVVAMMSRVLKETVKTFTIGFEEARYNELPYARVVANHFNTEHRELIVKIDGLSILPKLVKHFDEPFADSSMIPTYSKATKEFITVALSGDGGDELFGGYSSYLGTLGNYYIARWIPLALRKQIGKIGEIAPKKMRHRRQLIRLQYDPYGAFIDRSTCMYFNEFHRKSLFQSDILLSLDHDFLRPELFRREYIMRCPYDFINALSHCDFKTYLPDDILVKVDRCSMLVSLEVRSPMLDYRIVEFSFKNIHGRMKVKGLTTKYLLKKLARKILPDQLQLNRKWGFSIPLERWFRGSFFTELKGRLLEDHNIFFNKPYIEKLLVEHKSGVDHSGRLFVLLVFSLWKKNVFEES